MLKKFKMADLIAKKRNGEAHSDEEIRFICDGVKDGSIPDYQIAAWLMAVCFQGMTFDESAILTDEVAKSGDILDLSELGEYVSDKHSTGGVGDKATIALIPLLAATGMPVAKLSGRGLGHTGGTIDKLESIPGLKTALELDEFINEVKKTGAAIASQTAKLTPVDGKLYALRDVTSTVESIPLIAASVVSKKIAAGANVIVLDVKCGSGAFMKDLSHAEDLSRTMVEIGKRLNKKITAVVTSMDQPLGLAVGNSVEIKESIATLRNEGPDDLRELCLCLGAITLVNSKMAPTHEEARKMLEQHLEDGTALQKFRDIVIAQGGDVSVIDNPDKLPTAKFIYELKADKEGYISKLDALTIAKACKMLGAGREKKEDNIDYAVGVVLANKIGDKVSKGDKLLEVHANSEELGQKALEFAASAYEFSTEKIEKPTLIYEIIE